LQIKSIGVSDTKNDIVAFAMMQSETRDHLSRLLITHPHLQIPNASIDMMEAKSMG
jgi:hypothetical protein